MRGRALVIALHYAGAAALAAGGIAAARAWGPGLLAALEARDWVVTAPAYAWLLLAIPALIALRAHSLSDLPAAQQALSLVVRAGVVAALAVAMMAPEQRDTRPVRTATVYVVDASESMPDEALERARARLEEAWRRRGPHEVRAVVFAAEAREVPLPSGPQEALPPLPRPEGDGGRATDVQAALRLAMTLLPADRLGRLVLATDGRETRGALLAEADTLARFGVPVHFMDLGDLEPPAELMVTGVEPAPRIRPNIPFGTEATVLTTRAMKARCELLVDGVVATSEERDLPEGESRLTLETRLREGGDRELAVACAPVDAALDRFATNNRFTVPIHVPEKPKVLYVEGERRFGRNLLAALDRDFEVELRGPRGVPATAADAGQYDLVFISDVPRVGDMGVELVGLRHMKALEAYVRAGGGLVVAGGENSLGPGGYGGTYLEKQVLPVRLDVQKKEDIPSLALVLVIDRSGSMSGSKIELAKEAARATLDVLQPSDKLGIIAFDSAPTVVVRLQRAANRLKITDSLSRLAPGGGTNIFPALDLAVETLVSAQAKVKHIILLSDGKSNRTGVLDLVARAGQEKITISTVAVGMGADQGLLMQVGEEGGGRYYFTDRADNIPKLFLKETSEVTRRALVEDRFRPRVVGRYARLQMFRGVPLDRAPALLGYVSTQAKPRAEVLMTSHLGEPILARWRLGLGQVVVWTSDVKNKWAHFWLSWPGYAQLWRQILRDTLRVEDESPLLRTVTDVADGLLTVGVDAVDPDDRFLDGLTSEVRVKGPDGTERAVPLEQVAPGRYEGQVALDAFGPWTVRGTHRAPGEDAEELRSYAAVAWPFATEHLLGPPDLSAVRALAEATGGTADPTPARLFDDEGQTRELRTPRWSLPLYVALVLLVLDVLLRRVRFWGRTEIGWAEVSAR